MERFLIAIVGAGPVGIELALSLLMQSRQLHRSVPTIHVFDSHSDVGGHISQWHFVRLFSPFSSNISDFGRSLVRNHFNLEFDESEYPFGGEYLNKYLEPIRQWLSENGVTFHFDTKICGICKQKAIKGDGLDCNKREEDLFRLIDDDDRNYWADFVFDCTGSYSSTNHRWLGSGGLPACGERHLSECGRIQYVIPDVLEKKKEHFQGLHTVVVGSGYSAITVINNLLSLQSEDDNTKITWITRKTRNIYERYQNDPLPQRDALARLGNQLCEEGSSQRVTHIGGNLFFESVTMDGNKLKLILANGDEILCDNIYALIGYTPDISIFRELHVDLCWATEGIRALSTQLLRSSGSCESIVKDLNKSTALFSCPEGRFFVLGSKSYGRLSKFLIQAGLLQVQAVAPFILPLLKPK